MLFHGRNSKKRTQGSACPVAAPSRICVAVNVATPSLWQASTQAWPHCRKTAPLAENAKRTRRRDIAASGRAGSHAVGVAKSFPARQASAKASSNAASIALLAARAKRICTPADKRAASARGMRSKGPAKSARDFALTAAESSRVARNAFTCTENCTPGLLQVKLLVHRLPGFTFMAQQRAPGYIVLPPRLKSAVRPCFARNVK